MAKCKISTKAKLDLIDIWEYTYSKWSVHQADNYYNLILSQIEELSNSPNSGKSYEKAREQYLGYPVKSHIVFYRIKNDQEIEIIRILHSRMDLSKRLDE